MAGSGCRCHSNCQCANKSTNNTAECDQYQQQQRQQQINPISDSDDALYVDGHELQRKRRFGFKNSSAAVSHCLQWPAELLAADELQRQQSITAAKTACHCGTACECERILIKESVRAELEQELKLTESSIRLADRLNQTTAGQIGLTAAINTVRPITTPAGTANISTGVSAALKLKQCDCNCKCDCAVQQQQQQQPQSQSQPQYQHQQQPQQQQSTMMKTPWALWGAPATQQTQYQSQTYLQQQLQDQHQQQQQQQSQQQRPTVSIPIQSSVAQLLQSPTRSKSQTRPGTASAPASNPISSPTTSAASPAPTQQLTDTVLYKGKRRSANKQQSTTPSTTAAPASETVIESKQQAAQQFERALESAVEKQSINNKSNKAKKTYNLFDPRRDPLTEQDLIRKNSLIEERRLERRLADAATRRSAADTVADAAYYEDTQLKQIERRLKIDAFHKRYEQARRQQQSILTEYGLNTSRDQSSTAVAALTNRSPFAIYGAENVSPVSGGLVYGGYFLSHNVKPDTFPNKPEQAQSYFSARQSVERKRKENIEALHRLKSQNRLYNDSASNAFNIDQSMLSTQKAMRNDNPNAVKKTNRRRVGQRPQSAGGSAAIVTNNNAESSPLPNLEEKYESQQQQQRRQSTNPIESIIQFNKGQPVIRPATAQSQQPLTFIDIAPTTGNSNTAVNTLSLRSIASNNAAAIEAEYDRKFGGNKSHSHRHFNRPIKTFNANFSVQ